MKNVEVIIEEGSGGGLKKPYTCHCRVRNAVSRRTIAYAEAPTREEARFDLISQLETKGWSHERIKTVFGYIDGARP